MSYYKHTLSKEVKSNPKAFFNYAECQPKYDPTIPDPKVEDKVIIPGIDKASIFNTLLKSIFVNKNDSLPHFKPNYDKTISYIYFIKEKVKKKLKNLNPYNNLEQIIYIPRY